MVSLNREDCDPTVSLQQLKLVFIVHMCDKFHYATTLTFSPGKFEFKTFTNSANVVNTAHIERHCFCQCVFEIIRYPDFK